jgi:hypothetical protein
MKRLWTLLLFTILVLGLVGCTPPETTKALVLDEIPSQISSDFTLPTVYDEYNLEWFLNDVPIGYVLPLKYTFKGLTDVLSVKMTRGFQVITGEKEVTYGLSPITTKLYIQTENNQGINSKDTYVNGTVTLDSDIDAFDQTNLTMGIKGRGNSTWEFPKKPYRIKFTERQSLLGMSKAKDYVLLAEYNDKSLIRNYLAHYFSTLLDIEYTLETRFVQVFINGNYNGLYLLTEQVEVDKNRLNIDESADADGGFLIEMESNDRIWQEGEENLNWVRVDDYNYVIKSPKMEELTIPEVNGKVQFIKNTLNQFIQSIGQGTYESYMDMNQFIDYFIISELFKQVDVGYSSVYIYKDKNELMRMGPVWDFDISSGNGNYYDSGPQGYWVDYNPWFNYLIDRPEFESRYIVRFMEVSYLYFDRLIAELDLVSSLLYTEALLNFEKWKILGIYVWPNPPQMVEADTYAKQIQYLKNYLIQREQWLTTTLTTDGYR